MGSEELVILFPVGPYFSLKLSYLKKKKKNIFFTVLNAKTGDSCPLNEFLYSLSVLSHMSGGLFCLLCPLVLSVFLVNPSASFFLFSFLSVLHLTFAIL